MHSFKKTLVWVLVLTLVVQVLPFGVFAQSVAAFERPEQDAIAQEQEVNAAETDNVESGLLQGNDVLKVHGGELMQETKTVEAENKAAVLDEQERELNVDKKPICDYKFAEGVIEIPLGTDVAIADENDGYAITIKNYKTDIPAGSTIAVYVNYIAYVFEVESAEYRDGCIVVHSHNRPTDAILSAKEACTREISFDELEIDTEPQEIVTKDGKTVAVNTKSISVSEEGIKITKEIGSVTIEAIINNLEFESELDYVWYWPTDSTYRAIVSGDIDINVTTSSEISETLAEVPLFSWSPTKTGIDKVELYAELSGKISVDAGVHFEIGCEGEGFDAHAIRVFNGRLNEAEIEASAMLGVKGNIDLGLIAFEAKAGIGPYLDCKYEKHQDGPPMECISFHMTFKAVGSLSLEIPVLDKNYEWTFLEKEFGGTVLHKEDGIYVRECTYVPGGSGNNPGDEPGGPDEEPYYPEPLSGNFEDSQNSGPAAAIITPLWEYTDNDDGENTVTITKYIGHSSVLTVPDRIVEEVLVPADGENEEHVEYVTKFVTRIGAAAFANNNNLRAVTISEGITSLGEVVNSQQSNGTFYNCNALEVVNLPSSLLVINDYAFNCCRNLKTVNTSEGLQSIGSYAFWDCTSLEKMELPESLITIGADAFAWCFKLTHVRLPHNLKSVSYSTFWRCTNLEYVYIPKRLCNEGTNLSSVAPFFECENLKEVEFEDGVTRIPDCMFQGCYGLENIVIPDTVTEIGICAFERCTGLKQITLSDSLEMIRVDAFKGCASLTSVKLPDALTILQKEAFRGCTALTRVSLPESLKSIGEGAFYGCTALTSVSLPDPLTEVGSSAFANCTSLASLKCGFDLETIGGSAFNGCTKLANVELNYGLRTIGNSAFGGCTMLEHIELPETVDNLNTAFSGCTSLHSVVLSRRIQTITACTFQNCEALTDLVLPNGVKSISIFAFKDAAIKRITIPETVTSIDASAFTTPEDITVYGVPGSTAETFANSKGMTFVAIPETERVSSMQLVNGATQIIVPYDRQIVVNPDWFNFAPANHPDRIKLSSNDYCVSVVYENKLKGVRNGTARVTATASNGFEYSFDVAVKRLDSIEITHLPNKIAYAYGEPFCWDGLEVTAVFEDGSRQKLEKGIYDLRGFSSGLSGVKTMTASWCEKEASFEVTVDGPELFTVTFVNWDGTVLKTETVKNGDMATAPWTPARLCYNFTGWDRDFSNVTENMVVTAQYVEAHDYESSVKEPTCTAQGYTTYTCTRCGDAYTDEEIAALGHAWDEGVVTMEPTTETEGIRTYTCTRCGETKTEAIDTLGWVNPFVDISEEDYFYIPVLWAVNKQITAGTDSTHFSPNDTVTRAEAMMILYAAKGRPAYEKPNVSFTDVKKKHWAYDAIMWAVANGITGGTSETTFSPTKTCDRSEILTFLYAAMESPNYSIANPYTDVKNKHWYKDAAIWAYEAGIEKGENGKFNAKTLCTRGYIVTYLYRFVTGNELAE